MRQSANDAKAETKAADGKTNERNANTNTNDVTETTTSVHTFSVCMNASIRSDKLSGALRTGYSNMCTLIDDGWMDVRMRVCVYVHELRIYVGK